MNMNLSGSELLALSLWVVALVSLVLWGRSFRDRQRDLMSRRKLYYGISGALLAISLFGLLGRGLHYGLEFTGGTVVEVGAPSRVTTAQVREVVARAFPDFGEVQVQVGSELEAPSEGAAPIQKVLVRVRKPGDGSSPELGAEEAKALIAALEEGLGVGPLVELQITGIGATITGELKRNALTALGLTLALQLLYITLRFGNQLRFGLAADVALFHDVVIMVGFYALSGLPVDSPWVAALLTVAGYSVMDSVVIFDRIRENLKAVKGSFQEIVNLSVNETMTRSVNTTLTTLVVCVALYFFGGPTLKSFAFALLVGISAGAYSSIFVASPVLIEVDRWAVERDQARARQLREEALAAAPGRQAPRSAGTGGAASSAEVGRASGEAGGRPRKRRVKGTRRI